MNRAIQSRLSHNVHSAQSQRKTDFESRTEPRNNDNNAPNAPHETQAPQRLEILRLDTKGKAMLTPRQAQRKARLEHKRKLREQKAAETRKAEAMRLHRETIQKQQNQAGSNV